jgi:hypothetical protein
VWNAPVPQEVLSFMLGETSPDMEEEELVEEATGS